MMQAPLTVDTPYLSFRSAARWEWVLLAVTILIGGVLRLYRPELSYYNLHVERDVYRATQLIRGDAFPLLGSEMQYGGRVFGPLIYFLYAIPLAVTRSPLAIGIFIGALNTLLLGWAWAFTRYWFGPVAAITAAALYATFPLEVVQLRYLWNPCFLPLMILGMYSFLYRFLAGRRGWNFVAMVLFFSLAFQLHFSVLMCLPVILLGMIFMRRRPSIPTMGWSALLVVLLFLPMIVHELQIGRANVKDVIDAPDAVRSLSERYRFNPNAWRNLLHVVTLDWNETGSRLGFTYLFFLKGELQDRLGGRFAVAALVVTLAGAIQFLLWSAGLVCIGATLRGWWGRRHHGNAAEQHRARLAIFPQLLLLLWQFSPLVFLSFFNFHPMGKPGLHALIPIRYYLIAFPAQFIIAGLGVGFLIRLGPRLRPLITSLAAAVIGVYTTLGVTYLSLMAATGVALPYLHYRAPTLAVLLQLREKLLDGFHVNVDDYYERVTAQNVLIPLCGEATIDYLITQDPRAWRNSGLPPGTHLIIWAPHYRQPPDLDPPPEAERHLRLPEAAGRPQRILREESLGDLRIVLVEGELPRDVPIFNPESKRNFYYRQERMKYLGKEPL